MGKPGPQAATPKKQRSGPGVTLGARLLEPGDESTCNGSALERSSLAGCGCGSGGGGGGRGSESRPGAGMSRSSKAVLGLSVLLTAATVAGVHLKQRQDRQVGVT